ncbi:unnamed protein product [Didymodactylos carnosus]|uniref:Uncharacterized protein n=1 Tax=Didymodactylos carnosus TaxID=1234261 RepID=A0A813Y9W1_9BILA|nr:unnamed protein product [Didymodactylos carnosus]CAF1116982.1 unnamed protein product [Didymodactylos carnosus]CAF3667320.1 unnamed protein product [Didymodactylos carnosus]CAF3888046.1 unnamed protein product [Didymodactylos carnosus]
MSSLYLKLKPNAKSKQTSTTILRNQTSFRHSQLAIPLCYLLDIKTNEIIVKQALYNVIPNLHRMPVCENIERYCSTNMKQLRSMKITSPTEISSIRISRCRGMIRNSDANQLVTLRNRQIVRECKVLLTRLQSNDIENITTANIPVPFSIQEEKKSSSQKRSKKKRDEKTFVSSACKELQEYKQQSKRKQYDSIDVKQNKRRQTMFQSMNVNCIEDDLVIYLKCFICNTKTILNSNDTSLFTHWKLHQNKKLASNIYDSLIADKLVRVVEYYLAPRKHSLEGEIKQIFILDSKTSSHIRD